MRPSSFDGRLTVVDEPTDGAEVGATATSPDALRARLVSLEEQARVPAAIVAPRHPKRTIRGDIYTGLRREETPRVDRRTTTVIERNRRLYCRARPSYQLISYTQILYVT
jgi:hypothetical protein